jgi:hypothetical protein
MNLLLNRSSRRLPRRSEAKAGEEARSEGKMKKEECRNETKQSGQSLWQPFLHSSFCLPHLK